MQIVSLNKCSFHILTLKWSITEQTHGNMESISFDGDVIYASAFH